MAKFCTKCGSPVEESQKFCAKCGAPMAAAVPLAQTPATAGPVESAPVTPKASAPATSTSPAAPVATVGTAPKKSSPFVKILLVVVGIFVFVGVASMGTCIYVAYRAKQKISAMADQAKKEGYSLETPQGRLGASGPSSQTASAATQDVPPYPGSTATESGGGLTFGNEGGISSQEYETPDSVDQVLSFYKEKYGSKIAAVESEGHAQFSYGTKTGVTTVTMMRDEDSGKTRITIARMGK